MKIITTTVFMVITTTGLSFSASSGSKIEKPIEATCINLIKLYQKIGRLIPVEMCVFEPSCSNFAIESIQMYGPFKGIQVSANRLIRCNPSRIFEKDSQYIPIGGKLYDPPSDYANKINDFAPSFLVPGLVQFKKKKMMDGILAIAFTSIPIYGMANNDYKLDVLTCIIHKKSCFV
ncbi:MAG TPA: membrane protein insertion efficiency factor YidD [bacterium]|nr:membrane protein insertion efficiency factor YidD [bacterium]HPG47245.1 membrane protein insertion efficiency factor YidD [bacterium]HPM99549.1 membrane protein insertion efficiency factor YidD [bacterium]